MQDKWTYRIDGDIQFPRISGWYALLIEIEMGTQQLAEDAFGYFVCTEDNGNFSGEGYPILEAYSKIGAELELDDVMAWCGPFKIPEVPYRLPLHATYSEEV